MARNWNKVAEKDEPHLQRWQHRRLPVVGKALIIRTFALPTIMYLASVFTLPERIITRIHRAMFTFLWANKNELISRATCPLPWSGGGLNIPDLHHANRAVKTKWIQQISDRTNTATWTGFARYWLGIALSTVKPEWTWLRDMRKPHADPQTIPPWYKVIKNTVQEFRQDIISTPVITSKTVHKWLQGEGLRPRAEQLWCHDLKRELDFSSIWSNLWASLGENSLKDLMWKILHRVLTTKTYLASWGMNIDKSCPFCVRQETMIHCLFQCHRVHDLWQVVLGFLSNINGQQVSSNMELCVQYTGSSAQDIVSQYLVQLVLHIVWSTRNKQVLNNQHPQVNLVQLFKRRLRKRIEHDVTYHPAYVDQYWTINNVLCNREIDTVTFNF